MFKSSLSTVPVKKRLLILTILVVIAVSFVIGDKFSSATSTQRLYVDVLDSTIIANLDSVVITQHSVDRKLTFFKQKDAWILAKRDYRVDKSNWESLISSLSNLRIVEQASERDDRTEEFGLDSQTGITVEGFTSSRVAFELTFGDNAAGSGSLYMSDPSRTGVFVTSGLSKFVIERGPDLWIDKTLATNLIVDDIQMVRVENRDSSFFLDVKAQGRDSLGVNNYAVEINSSALADIDNSKVEKYITTIANLRCNDVLYENTISDRAIFDNPNITVSISTLGGRFINYKAVPNFLDENSVTFLLLNSENNRVYEMSRHNMVSLVKRETNFIIDKDIE